jgi:serine/threonine protein kinase
MGEVYRARDSRLGRDVALKVLPEELTHDPKRRARFEREARLIGGITHPNILSLYDIGEDDGILFAIFELLEGKTLRNRLAAGPIPAQRAAGIAAGVARGLAAAHAKGVIHRDLKPENVFLIGDGGVKVLDFGLARQMTLDEESEELAEAETEDLLTRAGSILGTVGYLSPEQVRGEPADQRSDIFALGCVLHEMLSGQRPFTGETVPEILTAVLREEPRKLDPAPALPGLARIVDRCLAKDADRRFQCAADLAFALDSLSDLAPAIKSTDEDIHGPPPRAPHRRLLLVASFLAFAALGFALAVIFEPAGRNSAAPAFERITFRRGPIFQARFSPGGTSTFYSASWDGQPAEVYETTLGLADTRSLGLAPATLLSVSNEGELAVALAPIFPTTFHRPGLLALLPATGDVPPRELLDRVSTADWDPATGDLVVVRSIDMNRDRLEWPLGNPLYEVDGEIGSLRVAPDGQHVAFFEYHPGKATLVVLDREGNRSSLENPWWVISGGLAWSRNGEEVWFTATNDFSPAKLWAFRPGKPLRLVLDLPGGMRLQDIAPDGRVLLTLLNFSISLHGGEVSSPDTRDLSWFGWSYAGDLSTDGRQLLFADLSSESPEGEFSWFLRPLTGGPAIQLTSTSPKQLHYYGGKLSPDGRFAAFPSQDNRSLQVEPVGAGAPSSINLPDSVRFFSSLAWLPDGQRLMFIGSREGEEGRQVFEQPLDGSPPRFLHPTSEPYVVLSPDGLWTAGRIDETTLRIMSFEGDDQREVEADAPLGRLIDWSADGSALFFYRQGEVPGGIYRIDLEAGHVTFVKRLMPPNPAGVWRISPVLVTPDGRHFAYSASRWMSDLYLFEGLH